MSDTKERIPFARAEAISARAVTALTPFCERIEVAGSIRRRRPDVGDIELVCVPKLDPGQRDLFGQVHGERNLLDEELRGLLADPGGVWGHRPDKNGRPAFGQRFKRLVYCGVPLDLFSVLPPAQWGVLFTIRTGPADFSHKLVTSRLQGGWMPAGMKVHDGALWDRGAVVPTPTEEQFFGALGLPFLEPEGRADDVLPAMRPRSGVWQWRRRAGKYEVGLV